MDRVKLSGYEPVEVRMRTMIIVVDDTIQYANYQKLQQMISYLTLQG